MLSACHAPALPSPPSTQFRKGRGRGRNQRKRYAIFKELQPFRNWVLGQSEGAGRWQDFAAETGITEIFSHAVTSGGIRSYGTVILYGSVREEATSTINHNAINLTSDLGPGRITKITTKYANETRPVNVLQPVIIYLGRPR